MTRTVELYIGSNNHTRKLELAKITNIIGRNHEGFTLKGVVTGYWRGEREEAAVVLLSDDESKIAQTLEELKRELNQEAIAAMQVPALEFV